MSPRDYARLVLDELRDAARIGRAATSEASLARPSLRRLHGELRALRQFRHAAEPTELDHRDLGGEGGA